MKSSLAPLIAINEKQEQQFPCISIILPFEPKKNMKAQLQLRLKLAVESARKELKGNYPVEKANSIINNLKKLISRLDYATSKKSIGIFVSPELQKVYYLDIAVNEKVVVDESFEIRDLVCNKKEQKKFLLLILSAKYSKVFLSDSGKFMRIISNTPEQIGAYENDIPERTGNFSDPSHRKEVMLEKFLRHIDDGLSDILKTYPLPLFVLGDDRILGHFRQLSHNVKFVVDYVHGDLIHAQESELRIAIQPYIADWSRVRERDLLNKLQLAQGTGKLVSGLSDVWKEAMQQKGRLLVVEKNYMAPVKKLGTEILDVNDPKLEGIPITKDGVDDIIEEILQTGGDVEFVEDGFLAKYKRIALILHY